MRPPSFVSRTLARVAAGGLILVAAVWLGGEALERQRFGGDQAAIRARAAAAVEARVREVEATLQRVVETASVDPRRLLLAAQGDTPAARELFERLAAATDGLGQVAAATVYGPTPVPLAWTGRPVEIPDARILGPAAVFLTPDAQGLRLIRVQPITLQDGTQRAGTVVLQAPLAVADPAEPDRYILPTAIVGVSVRPAFEGGAAAAPDEIAIAAVTGEVLASVSVPAVALDDAHAEFRGRARAVALAILAGVLLLATGPLLDWRRVTRVVRSGWVATVAVAVLVAAAYALVRTSVTAARLDEGEPALLFLAASLVVAGLAGLLISSIDLLRLARRSGGRVVARSAGGMTAFVGCQVVASAVLTIVVVGYGAFIQYGVASLPVDILNFGLRPWDWRRLAILIGLIVLHASVVSLGVVTLRLARAPWALGAETAGIRALTAVTWLLVPAALVATGATADWAPTVPTLLAAVFIAAVAWRIGRIRVWLRNASQASRLLVIVMGLVLPSVAFYPSMVDAAARARRLQIETRYAPEVLDRRRILQAHLSDALDTIDAIPGLDDLVRASDPPPQGAPPTDAAFLVWSQTELARERLTSSIELYDAAGAPVSRFALKLPDISGAPSPSDAGCTWDVFEEVSPFFAEERRLLHAGRAVCVTQPDGRTRRVGEVVVHMMLDYGNLSFVSAQTPYVALVRSGTGDASAPAVPLTFTVYGWSRQTLYTSGGPAAPLADEVFARATASRAPFWTTIRGEDGDLDAYVLNDRAGIYVLATVSESGFGHLVVLAELVTLAFIAFLGGVAAASVYGTIAVRTPTSGRALLREVRASFYRKLFLAFVASAVVPVVALAFVARAYFAALMLADIEMEATRTAGVASRVVEDFASLRVRGLAALPAVDDSIVVWLSRVIAQDVSIFGGPHLLASSERNLFASGLLPTRTPGDAYRAIHLEGQSSFVGRESVGAVEYLVAAAPVRIEAQDAILMVPLTSRQQEIEGQIAELDRRVLLAALLFIMIGSGIGYSMAERIADPVNRLMRATRRIARGDLDARVVATSSDELRRLVEAFNRMAEDLRRQRDELERTNRLAAWADMARQVAHDIKNPLTPIQLNAEHLLRVHADRGRPLGSLVDECVANILGQVRLLRQISGEFSSFASSPQPHPRAERLDALVAEIVEPYRAGLATRVEIDVDVAPDLPPVQIDRLLISRALTNVIENALHAMPGGGRLRLGGAPEAAGDRVALSVSDSGVGMDAAALSRIFEPYFSTKTTGTGLGLTIAKRNVEASGGRISVHSERGAGTTVTMSFPVAGR